MPYDPSLPANGSPNSSAEMRSQLNGLKALIDAILTVTAAQVDGVSTLNPGEPATVDLSVAGSTLHFTFGIPRGSDGSNGADGANGSGVSSAMIDGVTTLDPNQGATANVNFDTGSQVLHFSFGIPRGETGATGQPGPQGPPFANAVVDWVSTLDPGQQASVQSWFDGFTVHFSFGIPRGQDGAPGAPGEVSAAQLNSAIAGTSNNSNTVGTLDTPFTNDPPTLADMEVMRAKMNELILALRR
jgi:hypothetical protein